MDLEFGGMNFSCVFRSLSSHEIPHKDCLLPLFAKILGYLIIASSTICKVPQIYLILKNKSVKGLSAAAFELEVIGFSIALGYCIFKQLPFSAYGELFFLLIQSIIQVALIYYYSSVTVTTWLKAGLYSALAPTVIAGLLDPILFEALFALQHAIFFFSRIPQIMENYRNQSTGQLSFTTNFMNFAGCIVRLFTSLQEAAPFSMVIGSVLGIISNGIVVFQFMKYNKCAVKEGKKE